MSTSRLDTTNSESYYYKQLTADVQKDFDELDKASAVSKEIVDKIYESMMLKIGHKLMIHESYAKKDGYTSKWHVSQVKWYKKMLGHLLFIRKNKGYYKEVLEILLERYPHVA